MPGGAELFFIVLVIIMLFGSKKIPELARGLGKGMREIKNATGDIQKEIRAGASDLNSVKDSVNIEKQVKDLINDEKAKVSETSENKTTDEEVNIEESKIPEEQPSPQPVQRRGPYSKEEPQNSSEEL